MNKGETKMRKKIKERARERPKNKTKLVASLFFKKKKNI